MRLNRRSVTCGLCSAAGLSLTGLSLARRGWAQEAAGSDAVDVSDAYAGLIDMPDDGLPDAEDDFVCATFDVLAQQGLNITNFGPGGETLLQFRQRLKDTLDITDFGTASAHLKWKPEDGVTPGTGIVTLACGFFNGASDRQKQRVMNAANQWTQGGIADRLQFRFGYDEDSGLIEKAQVRILVGYPGYLTDVGRSALGTRKNEPTVRLYERLEKKKVVHEFGHVLALRHEHQHPDRRGMLKEDAIIQYFKDKEGWTSAQTTNAILKTWGSQERCIGEPNYAVDSIMSYDIPADLTEDNKRIRMASRVSRDDLRCVAGLYS